jgi:hypothetical protein
MEGLMAKMHSPSGTTLSSRDRFDSSTAEKCVLEIALDKSGEYQSSVCLSLQRHLDYNNFSFFFRCET